MHPDQTDRFDIINCKFFPSLEYVSYNVTHKEEFILNLPKYSFIVEPNRQFQEVQIFAENGNIEDRSLIEQLTKIDRLEKVTISCNKFYIRNK